MVVSPLLRNLGVLLLMVAWVVAAHVGSNGWGNVDFNVAVAISPIVLAVFLVLWRLPQPWLRWLSLLAPGAALVWLWPQLRHNVPWLYYLQHLGIHVALGVFFGKTLLGPGEALITRMARRIFTEPLSERNVRYTRGATVAWTLFFFGNALVSTALFIWAPLYVWSWHANVLTGPLMALMFLGEHICRVILLPPNERPGLSDVMKAYKRESALRNGTGHSRS